MEPAFAQSALAPRKSGLAPFLLASLVGHGVVVAGFLAMNLLYRPPPVDLDQKPIKASLVRLGKPRDQKMLPRKEEPPPPPAKTQAAPPSPTVAKAEPAAVAVPLPNAKPPPPAKKQDGDAAQRKQLFGAFSKAGQAAKPEELEGQADGSAMGDSAVSEGDPYFGLLKAQVQSHYDVSQTIPDSERIRLKAQVNIRIGKVGELLDSKLVQPSGNPLFDNAVLTAVKRAQPFSPPPGPLRATLQKTGVTLEFTP